MPGRKIIDGRIVFELYDTFGFPVDLTSLIARGYDLEIDEQLASGIPDLTEP